MLLGQFHLRSDEIRHLIILFFFLHRHLCRQFFVFAFGLGREHPHLLKSGFGDFILCGQSSQYFRLFVCFCLNFLVFFQYRRHALFILRKHFCLLFLGHLCHKFRFLFKRFLCRVVLGHQRSDAFGVLFLHARDYGRVLLSLFHDLGQQIFALRKRNKRGLLLGCKCGHVVGMLCLYCLHEVFRGLEGVSVRRFTHTVLLLLLLLPFQCITRALHLRVQLCNAFGMLLIHGLHSSLCDRGFLCSLFAHFCNQILCHRMHLVSCLKSRPCCFMLRRQLGHVPGVFLLHGRNSRSSPVAVFRSLGQQLVLLRERVLRFYLPSKNVSELDSMLLLYFHQGGLRLCLCCLQLRLCLEHMTIEFFFFDGKAG